MNRRWVAVLGIGVCVGGLVTATRADLDPVGHQSVTAASAASFQEKGTAETPTPTLAAAQPTSITPEEEAHVLPLAPAHVMVDAITSGVRVTWSGTGEDSIHYDVFRKGYRAKAWRQLASVKILGDNRGRYTFKDATAKPGVTYIYGVEAKGSYGQKSAMSVSRAITLPPHR